MKTLLSPLLLILLISCSDENKDQADTYTKFNPETFGPVIDLDQLDQTTLM